MFGESAFGLRRSRIGFEIMDFPLAGLMDLARGYVFVEVCCKQDSAVSRACKKHGLVYVGITHDMEKPQVFQGLVKTLKGLEPCKVFVHVSSPCSSGSPLKNLTRDDTISSSDVMWFDMFPHVKKYLKLGHHSSFELLWRNAIWNHVMTQRTLEAAKHCFDVAVHLCATGA